MTNWAEVDRLAEQGARQAAKGRSVPPGEDPEVWLQNRIEAAKKYARFRIENYKPDGSGECAHPFYETQIKKGPA